MLILSAIGAKAKEELLHVIREHFRKYPMMQITDLLKLIYQNEFGPEHMIVDEEKSMEMIYRELETLPQDAFSGEAVEDIGNGLCRVYLSAIKQELFCAADINRIFVLSANNTKGSRTGFEKKAALLLQFCNEGLLSFSLPDLKVALEELAASNYAPIRHSQTYRDFYAPAYRVVRSALVQEIGCDRFGTDVKERRLANSV